MLLEAFASQSITQRFCFKRDAFSWVHRNFLSSGRPHTGAPIRVVPVVVTQLWPSRGRVAWHHLHENSTISWGLPSRLLREGEGVILHTTADTTSESKKIVLHGAKKYHVCTSPKKKISWCMRRVKKNFCLCQVTLHPHLPSKVKRSIKKPLQKLDAQKTRYKLQQVPERFYLHPRL